MDSSDGPVVKFDTHDMIVLGTVLDSAVVEADSVAAFGEFVLEYVIHKTGINLMLSFAYVNYLSSSVLTELIRIREAVDKVGGRLAVAGLSEDVYRIFEITNLLEHLNVHKEMEVEDALARFTIAIQRSNDASKWEKRRVKRW